MQENWNESALRLIVTGTRRDGRRRYDRQSKQALVKACLQPGVSLAGMALKHGVNANLLRKWVVRYQLVNDAAAVPSPPIEEDADAFVPVMLNRRTATPIEQRRSTPVGAAIPMNASVTPPPRLRAQLPNGVTLDFDCTERDAAWLARMIEMLGRCDVSPRR